MSPPCGVLRKSQPLTCSLPTFKSPPSTPTWPRETPSRRFRFSVWASPTPRQPATAATTKRFMVSPRSRADSVPFLVQHRLQLLPPLLPFLERQTHELAVLVHARPGAHLQGQELLVGRQQPREGGVPQAGRAVGVPGQHPAAVPREGRPPHRPGGEAFQLQPRGQVPQNDRPVLGPGQGPRLVG